MELLWAIVGAVLGLLLTLFVQPFVEDKTLGLIVRKLGSTKRTKQSLAGDWIHMWSVESSNYPPLNGSPVSISQLRNHISAKFEESGRTYCVSGEVSQGSYVTGTWYDESDGSTYHGAFQLKIHPKDESMKGKWIGFSNSGEIKVGSWDWQRVPLSGNGARPNLPPDAAR
jgi:hypothetical protein